MESDMLWSSDALFEKWCENETNVRNEKNKQTKKSNSVSGSKRKSLGSCCKNRMPKTHECITSWCSPRTSLSGYTLNKDGVYLVKHANILTPHTAQNCFLTKDKM